MSHRLCSKASHNSPEVRTAVAVQDTQMRGSRPVGAWNTDWCLTTASTWPHPGFSFQPVQETCTVGLAQPRQPETRLHTPSTSKCPRHECSEDHMTLVLGGAELQPPSSTLKAETGTHQGRQGSQWKEAFSHLRAERRSPRPPVPRRASGVQRDGGLVLAMDVAYPAFSLELPASTAGEAVFLRAPQAALWERHPSKPQALQC